jgi:hypothetical protein
MEVARGGISRDSREAPLLIPASHEFTRLGKSAEKSRDFCKWGRIADTANPREMRGNTEFDTRNEIELGGMAASFCSHVFAVGLRDMPAKKRPSQAWHPALGGHSHAPSPCPLPKGEG